MHKLSFTIIVSLIAFYVQAQSPHGKSFQIDCVQCHTSDNWSVNRSNMQFDHDNTNFKLVGQHKETTCKACHTTFEFKEKRQLCVECHTDIHKSTVGKDCSRCHTPSSWIIKNTTEMHQQSRFPLLGAHRTASCESCHKSSSNLQFEPIAADCYSCHQKDFQRTTTPNHVQGGFSNNCVDCHSTNSSGWNTKAIDHSFFPLTAGHNIGCTKCHTSGKFDGLPTQCISCHQKNFAATQIPSHTDAGIPNTCETCHSTTAWKPSSFNHTTNAGYELKGTHKTIVQCADCHKGNLTSAKQTCISCHQAQYDNAPNHKQAGYSTDCATCHTPMNWLQSSFSHATTNFPLTGAHTTVDCALCHTTKLKGTPTICSGCHQKNFAAAQIPNHTNAGIPNTCETCHSTSAWNPSSFNHTTNAGYELKGGHKTIVQCADCHKGNLTSAKQTCISCHQVQYDNALNHKSDGYSTDCVICHGSSQTNWTSATIDHSFFPLTGNHNVECIKCHTSGTNGKIPSDCNSCHQKNYASAQFPGHVAAGIPTTCETCHNKTAWKPSSFDHTTNAGYELKGGHKTIVQCADCHKGNLTSASQTCISCHQAQYDSAPNHKSGGYSTDCVICHGSSQTNWTSATIDHSFFPLTGSHNVECIKCHTSGTTGKIPSDCNSCHQKNYASAQFPGHVAAGIPTTCETCHNKTVWKPSSFNHTTNAGYELKGAHKTLIQCSDCHKGTLTSAKQECISCHQTQYNTAPNHKQANYPTDCTKCHTVNNWLENSFKHSSTNFPLTGAHVSVSCNLCHTTKLAGTPTDCYGCHSTNYNSATNPVHKGAIPTTCTTCHTTTNWTYSRSTHTSYFPITTGRHNLSCATCHTNATNYTVFSCVTSSCHAKDHNQSQGSAGCYRCHPTGKGN